MKIGAGEGSRCKTHQYEQSVRVLWLGTEPAGCPWAAPRCSRPARWLAVLQQVKPSQSAITNFPPSFPKCVTSSQLFWLVGMLMLSWQGWLLGYNAAAFQPLAPFLCECEYPRWGLIKQRVCISNPSVWGKKRGLDGLGLGVLQAVMQSRVSALIPLWMDVSWLSLQRYQSLNKPIREACCSSAEAGRGPNYSSKNKYGIIFYLFIFKKPSVLHSVIGQNVAIMPPLMLLDLNQAAVPIWHVCFLSR